MDKRNIKILILGHNGMLGHVVDKYLQQNRFNVIKTDLRWPSDEFISFVKNCKCNYLINCIGRIPQKNALSEEFYSNNFLLPVFLSNNFNGYIIHPSSDCENYDCDLDSYAHSKLIAYDHLKSFDNIFIIKSSIIGPELKNKKSLWEWLVNNNDNNILGFCNHFWCGITTLEWAKICLLIINKKIDKNLIEVSTNIISKYSLLKILNKKLNLKKNIVKHNHKNYICRYVRSCLTIKNIENQIDEMIIWQNK
jgi:dTDP-4-dehydrorhamnose reductase